MRTTHSAFMLGFALCLAFASAAGAQPSDEELAHLKARLKRLEARLGALEALVSKQRAELRRLRGAPAPATPTPPAPLPPAPVLPPSVAQVDQYLSKAEEAIARGARHLAEAQLQRASKVDAKRVNASARGWWIRGKLHALGRRFKESHAAFDKSASLWSPLAGLSSPNLEARIYYERGASAHELGNAEAALVDLTRALELQKVTPKAFLRVDALALIARTCQSGQDPEGAFAAARDFLAEASPDHPLRAPLTTLKDASAKSLALDRSTSQYSQRFERDLALRQRGGSAATERAVTKALGWLARAQSKDGRWSSSNWVGLRAHPADGQNRGDGRYDIGVTSLALLAHLGRGTTHRSGPGHLVVARGLRWILRQQNPEGAFGSMQGEVSYNHALATAALCEAYGLSQDPRLRRPAERALEMCLRAQNPNLGWQYGIRPNRNDTSMTGVYVLALDSADKAGLEVPHAALHGALRWIKRATDSTGLAGYTSPGGGSSFLAANDGKYDPVPAMTALALVVRGVQGETEGPQVLQGRRALSKAPPTWKPRSVNFYYWHHGTRACFEAGGKTWTRWNKATQAALLPNQIQEGVARGSWAPQGEWCLAGGRVYATAINALTLESYYRLVGEE